MNVATLLETAALTARENPAISAPGGTVLSYGAFFPIGPDLFFRHVAQEPALQNLGHDRPPPR